MCVTNMHLFTYMHEITKCEGTFIKYLSIKNYGGSNKRDSILFDLI